MKKISHNGYQKEDVLKHGNKYMIANGYFGYRGTLDEYTKDEMVQFNLNGIYDQVGTGVRESINAYNPLYTRIDFEGVPITVLSMKPYLHEQELDMKNGNVRRITTFHIKDALFTIESERFADQINRNLMYEKYSFSTSMTLTVDIYTGIDTVIYDLSGVHLESTLFLEEKGIYIVSGKTHELRKDVVVAEKIQTDFKHKSDMMIIDNKVLHHYRIRLVPAKIYTIIKYTGVIHSILDAKEVLVKKVKEASSIGYPKLARQNNQFWEKKWEVSNVDIGGNKAADLAIKNVIYHLISIRPYSDEVSIPARGLSGQTSKGAVLWDTEVLILPFYLNTDLQSARRIVKYRINGLKAALAKAKAYGYEGAFYASESQEDGFDACSDYYVSDLVPNKRIRTYFKEKQIHINSAIVYAIRKYIERTDDFSVLFEGGFEMVFECARFYANYATLSDSSSIYEIKDVNGPDEYHERVNNNAYTNYMIKLTFDTLLDFIHTLRKMDSSFVKTILSVENREKALLHIRKVRNSFYLPKPNRQDIIEQFDGYFDLEDVSLEKWMKRVKHSNEYPGGKNSIVSPTKVIKQADVVSLLVLLNDEFSDKVKKANFDYYEPKTEQGSSFSESMYSMLAINIGNTEYAYPYFMKSAEMDLNFEENLSEKGIFTGGTHPASSGASYLSLIYGFAGLKHHGYLLSADYKLPKGMSSITFKVIVKNHIASLKVNNTKVQITWGDVSEEI